MKKVFEILNISLVFLLLSSCKTIFKQNNILEESKEDIQENINLEKTQIEKRFSCGQDGISKYIDDGWIITKEYSQEKICSWKTFPATKDCDLEKDKGCKITKPDKIGEEKIYILEK